MLYRPFGRTGESVSILGFGCMRLPVLDGRHDQIDESLATAMIRHAIDQGVNYVDTAWPYHGSSRGEPGESEPFVGRALRDGYRERVLLATKLPSWLVDTRASMDSFLERQLEWLQTDHLDCYLLHGLNADYWAKLRRLDVLGFLDSALADGRIRYAGFSFHGDPELFAPIVDAYDWSFCQIQYNYMDLEYQAGLVGLRYASERGLGVVVMEPLRGGRLAGRVPESVGQVLAAGERGWSPAEWALRFVWDDPGVSLLLSGMSAMEHVVENLRVAGEAAASSFGAAENATIDAARQAFRSRMRADCTACRYCLPCPEGVDIPHALAQLNDAHLYEDLASSRMGYFMQGGGKASECSKCGACEEVCPQGLPIRDLLDEAVGLFGE